MIQTRSWIYSTCLCGLFGVCTSGTVIRTKPNALFGRGRAELHMHEKLTFFYPEWTGRVRTDSIRTQRLRRQLPRRVSAVNPKNCHRWAVVQSRPGHRSSPMDPGRRREILCCPCLVSSLSSLSPSTTFFFFFASSFHIRFLSLPVLPILSFVSFPSLSPAVGCNG